MSGVDIHNAVLILPIVGVVVGDHPRREAPQPPQQQQQPQEQAEQRPRRPAPAVPEQARGRPRANVDRDAREIREVNEVREILEVPPPPGVTPIEARPGFEHRGRRGIKLENAELQGLWENVGQQNEVKSEIYQSGNEIVIVNDSRAWSPSIGKVHNDCTITFHEGGLIPLKAVIDLQSQCIYFCNGVTWRRANKRKSGDKKRKKCGGKCAMQ